MRMTAVYYRHGALTSSAQRMCSVNGRPCLLLALCLIVAWRRDKRAMALLAFNMLNHISASQYYSPENENIKSKRHQKRNKALK